MRERKDKASERVPPYYDPRGFKATCMQCHEPFYIPWETMCDAGICDKCMAKKPKRSSR